MCKHHKKRQIENMQRIFLDQWLSIRAPQEHLSMSGDILASSKWRPEARDIAKYPAMHRTAPRQDYLD